MKGGDQIALIGFYVAFDGLISFWYFWQGYFDIAQLFRIIRIIVGLYLVWLGGCYAWSYEK